MRVIGELKALCRPTAPQKPAERVYYISGGMPAGDNPGSEPSVAWFDISSLAVLAKKNSPISHASLETTVAFSQSNDVF